MRTLALDIRPMFESNWTGIPIFTARLARVLLNDPEIETVFTFGADMIESDAVRKALYLRTGVYLRCDYERRRSGTIGKRRPVDAALFPTVKTRANVHAREASIVHDMSTTITPEFHTSDNIAYHRRFLMREVRTNEVTFAVSQSTADDLILVCDVDPDKVRIIPQYVDWPSDFEGRFQNRYSGTTVPPFALVIGTIEPRKNLRIVLASLEDLLAVDPDLSVIIVGQKGWKIESVFSSQLETAVQQGRVIMPGFVTEFEKYCYLRLCRCTIFPSLFEGFGIPVLEAMSVGAPVLASWSSSIPEVGGSAVSYFDPLSRRDLVKQFRLLYADSSSRLPDLQRGLKDQAAKFTPDRFIEPVKQWLYDGAQPLLARHPQLASETQRLKN
jgi:glycosyltransferase involved in cell wall biosynthesis